MIGQGASPEPRCRALIVVVVVLLVLVIFRSSGVVVMTGAKGLVPGPGPRLRQGRTR